MKKRKTNSIKLDWMIQRTNQKKTDRQMKAILDKSENLA